MALDFNAEIERIDRQRAELRTHREAQRARMIARQQMAALWPAFVILAVAAIAGWRLPAILRTLELP